MINMSVLPITVYLKGGVVMIFVSIILGGFLFVKATIKENDTLRENVIELKQSNEVLDKTVYSLKTSLVSVNSMYTERSEYAAKMDRKWSAKNDKISNAKGDECLDANVHSDIVSSLRYFSGQKTSPKRDDIRDSARGSDKEN